MSTEIDYKHEFKKYIRECIDRHYHTNPSAIAGGSFYNFYVELYDSRVIQEFRTFGERRALAEQHGNIYKAWLSWDFRKYPSRPPFEE